MDPLTLPQSKLEDIDFMDQYVDKWISGIEVIHLQGSYSPPKNSSILKPVVKLDKKNSFELDKKIWDRGGG